MSWESWYWKTQFKQVIKMEKYITAFNTLGNSGADWIDSIFRVCVIILVDLAEILGISYEAINIIIFIIIQPGLILLFLCLWLCELKKN